MITFKAVYFDGRTSRSMPVDVEVEGSMVHVHDSEGSVSLYVLLDRCTLEPPLGSGVRTIRLPDGGLLETEDHGAFNAIPRTRGRSHNGLRFVHALESHWKAVILCVVCLVLFIVGITFYGMPFAANQVARAIPPAKMERVSRESLAFLDGRFLQPSKLSDKKKREVTRLFGRLSAEVDPSTQYRVEFRASAALGANALALPSGLVLVTDDLVALARSDRELAGILVHEITHIKKRHAVRQILQTSGVVLLISTLMGDIASISSFAASIPTLLVQSGYSRQFEREADKEAGRYLIRKGWGTKPFEEMLKRVSKGRDEGRALALVSTHPRTEERIRYLQQLGQEKPAGKPHAP
jgi:Zn-dependent protease with chaperone function